MSIKILIVGPAASGKTTLAKKLAGKRFKVAKLHTTRPKRDENDDEYYFTIPCAELAVSCVFNGWEYSLTKNQFYSGDIFIVGPKMAQQMKDFFPEYRFLIIFLDVPESIRYERLIKREMPGDSVIARIGRDRADFANFTEYDIRLSGISDTVLTSLSKL